MNGTILRYKSDPNIYDIQSKALPYHGVINDLSISEKFLTNDRYKQISSDLGYYQLNIETEVDDKSEIQSKHFEIKNVINELDRSWMYACGHPLNKKNFLL